MDDLFSNDYLDVALGNPDLLLGAMLGGMARAEERFRSKLNTVDAEGNVIDPNEVTQQLENRR